jgi:long-chain fatty acid transport protein
MKRTILRCAVAAALVNTGNAVAGGLWLNDFGDFAGGRASAGASAGVNSASTISHNPASSSRIESDQLFLAGGVYLPNIKFDVEQASPELGYNNGGDAGEVAPGASFAYVHSFDDRWSGGVYLGGLAGAGLDYDDDWTGRYNATSVDLFLMILAPTAAYRVTDSLSIGVGVQFWYSELTQKLAVPSPQAGASDGRAKLDGDDTGFGFTLGAMYELTDRTRFGAHYQSELKPKHDGDLKLEPADLDVHTETELDLAQYVRLSMHHDLDEKWGLNFTVGWDDWSELDNIFISVARGGTGIPTKWRDTYHYSWGAEYQLNSKWAFTGGVSYDTNPVDARNRTPELPVDRQIHYAMGTQYQLNSNVSVGGYMNYADLGKGRIHTEYYSGKFNNNGILNLSVYLDWKF